MICFHQQAQCGRCHSSLHCRAHFKSGRSSTRCHFQIAVGVLAEPEVTRDRDEGQDLSIQASDDDSSHSRGHIDRSCDRVARHADRERLIDCSPGIVEGHGDARRCRTCESAAESQRGASTARLQGQGLRRFDNKSESRTGQPSLHCRADFQLSGHVVAHRDQVTTSILLETEVTRHADEVRNLRIKPNRHHRSDSVGHVDRSPLPTHRRSPLRPSCSPARLYCCRRH